jgi:hypothetical protein
MVEGWYLFMKRHLLLALLITRFIILNPLPVLGAEEIITWEKNLDVPAIFLYIGGYQGIYMKGCRI